VLLCVLLCGAVGLGLIVFSMSCLFEQEAREYVKGERSEPNL